MEWKEVKSSYYKVCFPKSTTIFHSVDFNELNSERAEEIIYLVYSTSDFELGCILGKKSAIWYSPFSSPFGGIELKGTINKEEVITAINHLCEHLGTTIQITLPPKAYSTFIETPEMQDYVDAGFHLLYSDFNYHLNLMGNFEDGLKRNAKKNLNKAMAQDHRFIHAHPPELQEQAYAIIATNRKEKGYSLKMSLEQIRETNRVVQMDFFILEMNSNPCAAALIYEVNQDTAMVVYWGHLEEAAEHRPVNLLAHYLFKEYSSRGYKLLDIGPSSEHGVLNEGLANFKLSLGCLVSEKPTLRYDFN